MSLHLNPNDPNCKNAAAEILRRHDIGAPEANITTAVRDFLTATGLVKDEEMDEENPPAEGSRQAVDLTALDTFIEFKRRIGTAGGFNPDPQNVQQLDDYLAQSEKQGRVRLGIQSEGDRSVSLPPIGRTLAPSATHRTGRLSWILHPRCLASFWDDFVGGDILHRQPLQLE